jgi:hypothetical protein
MPAPGRTISLQHIADVYMRCKTAAELSASSTGYIFLSTDSVVAEVMNRVGQQHEPFTLLSEYGAAAKRKTTDCPLFFLAGAVFQAALGDERVLKSFQRFVKKQLGQNAGGACCIGFATDASADNRQLLCAACNTPVCAGPVI